MARAAQTPNCSWVRARYFADGGKGEHCQGVEQEYQGEGDSGLFGSGLYHRRQAGNGGAAADRRPGGYQLAGFALVTQ